VEWRALERGILGGGGHLWRGSRLAAVERDGETGEYAKVAGLLGRGKRALEWRPRGIDDGPRRAYT
jgi:hypothetical protein